MEKLQLQLTVDEVNTILKSLGNLPYTSVYEIIEKIQLQAREQLEMAAAATKQKETRNGVPAN